ncbi:ras-like GTP-binding protein RhoL isoform X2 [Chrysoperla carnea]|nr:ras-like GTP-binding protein RhoL isoform X2 [Chrysoperla carnea]XP_044743964.1 ras-like GTP-binding protein RhoL isoform X2 [Chrysoperla carnea]XP_044743965.1 ras-like GTP-binding protein RhoL isoform X2 [Chrysoperla carnea]XP_044743966.1 ras-like GTP-binding protein RhoL isoform X2 [Chrysoperla carnea]XP_044743967.1 ras-like GTP-binding protein RhoL isoform X2 [Chrysoperla carnea]
MGGTDNENLKITVVGDGLVGKTCLLIVYTSKEFPTEYVPTVFENYSGEIVVDEKTYSLSLWDTAGQEDYERLRPLSYPKTRCFLLCYAVNSRPSFDNILSKWYPEVKHFKPDIPIILVATKIDLRNDPTLDTISTAEGKRLRKKIKAYKLVECSAKNQEGLDDVFTEAVRAAVSAPKTKQFGNCILL